MGERPVKPIVTVCGWCPDRAEQTAAARALGFDVSHGMCAACAAAYQAALERRSEVLAERLREAVDL